MYNFFFLLLRPFIMELSAQKNPMYLSYNNRKYVLTFPCVFRECFGCFLRNLIRLNLSFIRSVAYSCKIYFRRDIFRLTIHSLTNIFYLFLVIMYLCMYTRLISVEHITIVQCCSNITYRPVDTFFSCICFRLFTFYTSDRLLVLVYI
jgi:hypothetical protein